MTLKDKLLKLIHDNQETVNWAKNLQYGRVTKLFIEMVKLVEEDELER